jgi:hypothetical protein
MNGVSYFFSAIFLLKFRKTGPRTKLPKSPRTLPPQPLVDMSALENFQSRPVNTFSVARNVKYRVLWILRGCFFGHYTFRSARWVLPGGTTKQTTRQITG